jgi:hypothetical protein
MNISSEKTMIIHENPEKAGPCLGFNNMDSDEEENENETAKPNMEFITKFEESLSYPIAANFIRGWFTNKKFPSNTTEFALDFPVILDRAIHVRSVLVALRKARGSDTELVFDAEGLPTESDILKIEALVSTKKLYANEDDFIANFTLNLLKSCC